MNAKCVSTVLKAIYLGFGGISRGVYENPSLHEPPSALFVSCSLGGSFSFFSFSYHVREIGVENLVKTQDLIPTMHYLSTSDARH